MEVTTRLNKIAVYGGTFNPVHSGHFAVAENCQQAFNFDRFLIIPSSMPPHKAQPISAAHRLAMLRLVFKPPLFEIDERELSRQGYSYTIDTVKELRQTWGASASITFIMGMDSFIDFDQWEAWQNINQYVHLLLINRPGFDNWQQQLSPALKDYFAQFYANSERVLDDAPAGSILLYDVAPNAASSTQIRQAYLSGESPPSESMIDAVKHYIDSQQLYNPDCIY